MAAPVASAAAASSNVNNLLEQQQDKVTTQLHQEIEQASTSLQNSTETEAKPKVGATNVDHLMLVIQARALREEKLARGEVEAVDNSTLLPPIGILNGGVGRRNNSASSKYKCDFPDCNKSFSQKTHLIIHGRSHTGDRPFVCSFEGCNKRFSQNGNLKTHAPRTLAKDRTRAKPARKHLPSAVTTAPTCSFMIRISHLNVVLRTVTRSFHSWAISKRHQNKFHNEAINQLMHKFRFYGTSSFDGTNISNEETELFKHFSDLYKNSNRGIKGRGREHNHEDVTVACGRERQEARGQPAIADRGEPDPAAGLGATSGRRAAGGGVAGCRGSKLWP